MSEDERDGLNVRLAKLLGWRVEAREVPVLPHLGVSYWLFAPNGSVEYQAASEAAAWQHAPDFEHDLNTTLATIPVAHDISFHRISDSQRKATIFSYPVRIFTGEGSTDAQAAALALEAWATARQEAGE